MNEMSELQYPAWQGPLQEVILELDLLKFSEKAMWVETLILERLRHLKQSNDGHSERMAIADGLSILKKIKRERLGFPDS